MRPKITFSNRLFSPWSPWPLQSSRAHRHRILRRDQVRRSPLSRTRPIVIAICPKSLDNPVFVDAKETAELDASRRNVILEWVGPFKVDPAVQVKVIEGLIWRKVDGIAISTSDPEKIRGVIDKATAAGIKVATMDADCPNSKRLFYCGTDNYKAGFACGEAMVKVVPARGLAGKRLRTAILTGGIEAHNLNERIRGLRKPSPDGFSLIMWRCWLVTMIPPPAPKWSKLTSETSRRPRLSFSRVAGPFSPLPNRCPFIRNGAKGGIAVSMDTFYPVLQAAKKGFAQALVGQDFRRMGELTVNYLACAIKGLPLPGEYIDTGLELADQSNFDRLRRTKSHGK